MLGMQRLVLPRELDLILRYPKGRCLKLAKAGKLPHIKLPDGEIRFDLNQIDQIIAPAQASPGEEVSLAR